MKAAEECCTFGNDTFGTLNFLFCKSGKVASLVLMKSEVGHFGANCTLDIWEKRTVFGQKLTHKKYQVPGQCNLH